MPLIIPKDSITYRVKGLCDKYGDYVAPEPAAFPEALGIDTVMTLLRDLPLMPNAVLLFPEYAGEPRIGTVRSRLNRWNIGNGYRLAIAWPDANFMPHVWFKGWY